MSKFENTILDDERPIKSVWFDDAEESRFISAGEMTIEAYAEPGEYCHKPWIRILRNGEVIQRFHAQRVRICYE